MNRFLLSCFVIFPIAAIACKSSPDGEAVCTANCPVNALQISLPVTDTIEQLHGSTFTACYNQQCASTSLATLDEESNPDSGAMSILQFPDNATAGPTYSLVAANPGDTDNTCSTNAFVILVANNGAGTDGDKFSFSLSSPDASAPQWNVNVTAKYTTTTVCEQTCHSFDAGCVTETNTTGNDD
jgi:hypothetical protein